LGIAHVTPPTTRSGDKRSMPTNSLHSSTRRTHDPAPKACLVVAV
jgi:hypothetical protein